MQTKTYLSDICHGLRCRRFNFNTESELQVGIAEMLTALRIPFKREVRISTGRLDFLCEHGLAIEVKCAWNKGRQALIRQITGYATDDRVSAILVVTSGTITDLPAELNGKPVAAHFLIGSTF